MGTWGSGNFDDDTAADYLLDLCGALVTGIEETVKNETLMEPDEPSSALMMCNVEILATLAENIRSSDDSPLSNALFPNIAPDPETVSNWKAAYLRVWDGYIDELEPKPGYKEKRRRVIETTFDRLIEAGHPRD